MAQKYLHKDRLAILVVGKPAEFDRPLSSFGPVTNIDITIPPPPSVAKGMKGVIGGDLRGTLDVEGQGQLHIVLHISETNDGSLTPR